MPPIDISGTTRPSLSRAVGVSGCGLIAPTGAMGHHLLFIVSSSDLINCMNASSPRDNPSHSLADLCVLTDLPLRTVRYYVQIGLVARPEGETRAARYGQRHLEQLLLIKKWTAAGLSLDRVRELLRGEVAPIPPRPRAAGSVEVCSHLTVADGIEIVIEPGRAGLSPELLRRFARDVMAIYQDIRAPGTASEGSADGQQRDQQRNRRR